MIFTINKASDWDFESELDITSLDDLINFIKENGEIIMTENKITIYNDYVE